VNLGLHTDLYEIRMVESYLAAGMTAPATFSLFVRPHPARPWLLAAGLQRVHETLAAYRFGASELDYLRGQGVGEQALAWFEAFEAEGELVAVPEGTVVLGDEPLLELTAPLPVAQLLETVLLNVVHLDTLLATEAARCVVAAQGRSVVDFGFRRAHGFEAGMRVARCSHLAGATATSNVEAGRRFGLPIAGTMAHAFVQAHDDEREAFRRFARDHPQAVTLLVDTYDTVAGVDNAIAVADELAGEGIEVDAIRLDSEPLDELARSARARLDRAGRPDVRIFASGGLDEERIAALVAAGAPIDGFGVGTAMAVSRDHPALDIVYKLVAYDGVPRAKYSTGKELLPGPKQVTRPDGPASDVLDVRDGDELGEGLLRPTWRDGEVLHDTDLLAARERAAGELGRLPEAWTELPGPDDPPVPRVSEALRQLATEVRGRELA
jgi:nicotinate phosphoribosyltransferase